ncbi:hypothetical protein J6N69_00495 [bacterium]|nr:hypothetical protein [bacterium]
MVKILDCTIRDGGHQTNWDFDDEFIFNLVKKLERNNIDYCEIGYRNNIDKKGKGRFFFCDKLLLEKFIKIKNNLKIGIMADYKRIDINDFESAENDLVDFVRIACHPDKIPQSLEICEELKFRGYNVFLQLMEIPNVSDSEYNILKKWDKKDILESLYIADSYSVVEPQDIPVFFEKLKNAGFEKISFHSHNGKGFALANTLKAIECGAYSIDVCQNGLGGNLNFGDYKNCL